jgi:hypothetical protein
MRKRKSKSVNNDLRLLILACSARKCAVTGKVAAWELYDGIAFRVVKRLQREGRFPNDVDILILSGRYGLIHPTRKIKFYEQRMTYEGAKRQAKRNCALLRRLFNNRGYSKVFVNVGKTYLAALQPVETWLPQGVALTIAEGGIGRKLKLMKQWLEAGE